eukprot:1822670-Pyramimonas_sp.AAC.1
MVMAPPCILHGDGEVATGPCPPPAAPGPHQVHRVELVLPVLAAHVDEVAERATRDLAVAVLTVLPRVHQRVQRGAQVRGVLALQN